MKTKPLDEVMQAATPGPITITQCPCGHHTCDRRFLSNGVFYQGSGFDPPDAALLAHYWNYFPKLVEALDSVDAEWRSDPTSTQCFDSRLIAKAREALAQAKQVQMP